MPMHFSHLPKQHAMVLEHVTALGIDFSAHKMRAAGKFPEEDSMQLRIHPSQITQILLPCHN